MKEPLTIRDFDKESINMTSKEAEDPKTKGKTKGSAQASARA